MRSGAVVKSFNYIIQEFFADPETKAYLKKVLSFCEQQKTTLLLEINPQVGQPGLRYLALSHLQHLPKGFVLLYPYPHLLPSPDCGSRRVTPAMADMFDFDPQTTKFPPHTYVIVPADTLLRQKLETTTTPSTPEDACSEKRTWEDTLEIVEEHIEDYFPAKKWQRLKNLTKEILTHPHFCITKDGKTIQLHRQPKTRVPLMDYLSTATRQAGPSETLKPQYAVYVRMTKALVDNGSPASLFQNKLLLRK